MDRSTLGTLVRELTEFGLLTEASGSANGAPGRPSLFVLASQRYVALAVELAEQLISVSAIGIGGAVLGTMKEPNDTARRPVPHSVRAISALATRLLETLPNRPAVVGTGLAVPGLVRRSDGFVRTAPNLGWQNVPLGDLLERESEVLGRIEIGHAGTLGTIAEQLRGAGVGIDDLVYLTGRVGTGGGVVVGGRLLEGSVGYASEFGHMVVERNGRRCACGARGCWETTVGQAALLRESGIDPQMGEEGVRQVLREATAGSATAGAAIDRVGRWVGIGLAGLVNIFNPKLIVLDGLYSMIYPWASAAIDHELRGRALDATRGEVHIVPSQLGESAPIVGAGELVWAAAATDPAAIGRRSTTRVSA